MRALILHVNKFKTKVNFPSNKPRGIIPEKIKKNEREMKNGLVVFFCVEEGDTQKHAEQLYDEIYKASNEIKTKNVVINPFVHLSKNIAKPHEAKKIYEYLTKKVKNSELISKTSPFGYHKNLILDIKGHPGSFRYREF